MVDVKGCYLTTSHKMAPVIEALVLINLGSIFRQAKFLDTAFNPIEITATALVVNLLNGEDRLSVRGLLLLHDAPHLRLQILEGIWQLLAESQGAPKSGLRLDDPPELGFKRL